MNSLILVFFKKKLLDSKIFLKFSKFTLQPTVLVIKSLSFQGDDKPLGGGGKLKPQPCAVRTSLSCKVSLQS
ncbi:MAG: hypothetical protein LBL93_04110, partial [Ruminococcus sp.]|nr:hypothetical protein [Ruminococcus sp.]